MSGARNRIFGWIIPKDAETLRSWLVRIELGNLVISALFVVSLVLALVQTELVPMARYAFFCLVSLLFLSFLTALQYLLAIEFNTRKNR